MEQEIIKLTNDCLAYFQVNCYTQNRIDKYKSMWKHGILIPFMGNHRGPRVHDLRHTFAVHALVQMAGSGQDLYNSLPVISTCLGHKSIAATEQYVRLIEGMYPELISQSSPVSAYVFPKVISH